MGGAEWFGYWTGSSSANGGHESASTPSPLRRHCQWTETASSGENG